MATWADVKRIPVDELREVMIESWLAKAPTRLAATYLQTLEESG